MVARRRYFEPGYVYHVLNRGAQRRRLFLREADYVAFEELIQETFTRFPLPLLTYQLMPNHWHFVVRPNNKDELSSFFHHLAGTHAKRYRAQSLTTGQGHVYQDRFKSFPVQSDSHFLTVCRYVERNALRAGLVERAEDWRWGGLFRRQINATEWLQAWPVERPRNWLELVNQPITISELAAIRESVRRGRPFGSLAWTRSAAEKIGLCHTLKPRGRPTGKQNASTSA